MKSGPITDTGNNLPFLSQTSIIERSTIGRLVNLALQAITGVFSAGTGKFLVRREQMEDGRYVYTLAQTSSSFNWSNVDKTILERVGDDVGRSMVLREVGATYVAPSNRPGLLGFIVDAPLNRTMNLGSLIDEALDPAREGQGCDGVAFDLDSTTNPDGNIFLINAGETGEFVSNTGNWTSKARVETDIPGESPDTDGLAGNFR